MTTVVTNTLRAAGGNYSDIKLWEDDIPPDLVTLDEQWVLECYDDWPEGYQVIAPIYIDERECSQSNNIVITVPDSDKFKAVTGGACLFYCDSITNFSSSCNYVDISHLRITLATATSTPSAITWGGSTTVGMKVHHNVIDDQTSTTSVPIYDNSSAGNGEVYNNLIVKTGTTVNFTHAIRMRGTASQIYNNVGIGFHRTFRADANGSNAYNNIAYGFTDYGFEGTLSGDNNASQDDSAPGANSIDNITSAEFVNYTGDMAGDYHLASNSQLKGAGYNLVENALQSPPQYDIDGDEWPTSGAWDIGFDKYIESGTTLIKKALRTNEAWTANQAEMEALYGVDGYYPTLSAWWSDVPVDLVDVDEVWTLEVYNDWPGGLEDTLDMFGRTADAGHEITIRAADGEGHNGVIGDGFRLRGVTDYVNTICVRSPYVNLHGFTLETTAQASALLCSTYGHTLCSHMIIIADRDVNGSECVSDVGDDSSFEYNLLYDGKMGFTIAANSNSVFYNNTVINCNYGFYKSTGDTHTLKNNVVYDSGTNYDLPVSVNDTNNASEDGTAVGTNPYNTVVANDFKDAAGNDYRLSSTSNLIDKGINLIESGDLASPQYDIEGDQLPDTGLWCIGFDYTELVPVTSYIYMGDTLIENMYSGAVSVTAIYQGTTKVF